MDESLITYLRDLPKAELHVHVEGTLEPDMMFAIGRRNGVPLAFGSVEETRAAYDFADLQSFLDLYYQGASVLQSSQDFYDLTLAYLERAASDGVRRAEMFFDPQTHTARGVPFDVFMPGMWQARDDAAERFGISSDFILCILRHLPPHEAVATMEAARPWMDRIIGVGLDSSERGHPPEPFADAYRIAREAGLHSVAHAGEEGPPAYIAGALDALGAERIDHGATAIEDASLMERLRSAQIPLTVCPLSSAKLHVYPSIEDSPIRSYLDSGLKVTINSDDPAYFGGYILDNYLAVAAALELDRADLARIARNSLEACFLPAPQKADLLAEFDAYRVSEG